MITRIVGETHRFEVEIIFDLNNSPNDVADRPEPFTSNDNEAAVFVLLIEDDRYTVPTLSIIEAGDVSKAREQAVRALRASPHHLKVEARRDDELLFLLNRDEVC